MRVLLLNPPHIAIGSRIPLEQLPPLGLLSIGGPLIDAGHDVELLDAEARPADSRRGGRRVVAHRPQALHDRPLGLDVGAPDRRGADAAHPREAAATSSSSTAAYFRRTTFAKCCEQEPQIDVIVRGEGEETALRLMAALENGERPDGRRRHRVPARRRHSGRNASRPTMIDDLDAYRVGWELIDHRATAITAASARS